MFGMFPASIAGHTARRDQERKEAIVESQRRDDLARYVARQAIEGRSFKCGPWSWRFVSYLPGNVERVK